MGVLIEINAGPMAGKVIGLKTGESVTVGRAAGRAQFALPQDTFMSGVHFAVECGAQGCRVIDQKSSNGTFLNGARIKDAMLANCDEIKGGQTTFSVKIVADAKLASLSPPEKVAPADTPPSPSSPPAPAPSPSPPKRPLVESPVVADPGGPALNASALAPSARVPRAAKPEAKEPPALSVERPQEPPAPRVGDASPRPSPDAEQAAKNAQPRAEEPPRVRATPGLPSVSAQPPRAADLSADGGAKPPRSTDPPPAVAPRTAEKSGDRSASRNAISPESFAFSVMGWSFPAAPAEWQVQTGFGLQQSGHEEFPSSLAASEEFLGGITLQQYVESQISTLRGYLRAPTIEPTMPPRVSGADESMAMDVRHSTKDGRELIYRRIYARSGSSVGVLTVTTLASDFSQVLQSLQPLLDGAAFRSTINN